LHPLCASDLCLVGADERAAADDILTAHDQPVDAMGCGEDESGDGILRPSELEDICTPDGQVGALPGLERADVLATEHRRSAARAEAKRLASR